MAVEFFKNLAAVCSSDKIPTREVDINPICVLSHILISFNFSGRNFVNGADGSRIHQETRLTIAVFLPKEDF